MPHFGIAHEDEAILRERRERFLQGIEETTPTITRPESLESVRDVRPPVDNILSQSLANVSPLRTGRTGVRGGGIVSEVAALPSAQPRGMLARIGELPVEPREGEFVPRRVTRELGLQPREERQPPSVFRPEARVGAAAAGAEVFTPSTTGITPPATAPVLGKIDFTSIEGLLKGVGSVAEFTRNLQKFNRSRGITPGKKGGQAIKTSDIQNRIKFLQTQLNEGIVTEEQEASVTDELDILNQFIQGRLGVGATRATRAREEEQRRLDLEAIRAL